MYTRQGDHDNARLCYTRALEDALHYSNYFDAAQIAELKLKKPEQALELLLKGWTTSRQADQCLQHYIKIILRLQPHNAAGQINTIFAQTPPSKRNVLLNVLERHQTSEMPESFALASRNVAYRIISELALEGNTRALQSLKAFQPNDRLVSADYTRYTTLRSKTNSLELSGVRLDRAIRWVKAISHNNQFIALGIKDKGLYLARGNWNGNIEYTNWNVAVSMHDRFSLIADPDQSSTIILLCSRPLPLDTKVLERNASFDQELTVITPTTLPDGCLGMTFNANGSLTAVENNNYRINLLHYTTDFASHTATLCTIEGSLPFVMTQAGSLSEVLRHNDRYFTYTGSTFFSITTAGLLHAHELDELIWLSDISPDTDYVCIVLVFETGFFVYRQPHGTQGTLERVDFDSEITPTEVRFVSDDKFVICGKQKMVSYRIVDADTVEEVNTRHTSSTGRSILKGRYRNQYALLSEIGTIELIRAND